jgi:hypothetical protein
MALFVYGAAMAYYILAFVLYFRAIGHPQKSLTRFPFIGPENNETAFACRPLPTSRGYQCEKATFRSLFYVR